MRRVLVAFLALPFVVSSQAAHANGCPQPCSGVNTSPPGSELVFVQPEGEAGPLVAYDTRTLAERFTLPAGRASADGRSFYVAVGRPTSTVLKRYDASSGNWMGMVILDGRWTLASVSPRGVRVALTAGAGPSTRVAIVNSDRLRLARRISLRGRFEVESISDRGDRLFLIEHLARSQYRLRLYDVAQGTLRAGALRGPGEPSVMAGRAWSAVASPNGRWLLTLYLNTPRSTAFVHALDLHTRKPTCIFLPGRGGDRLLSQYTLTLASDLRTLYAVNPAVGVVARIDLRTRRVDRIVTFPSGRPRQWRGASALSLDRRWLYVASGQSVWGYDTARGTVRGPFGAGRRVTGMGFTRDGEKLFVVRDDGRVLVRHAPTGRALRA